MTPHVNTATTKTRTTKKEEHPLFMNLYFWIPFLIVTSFDARFVSRLLLRVLGLRRFQAQVDMGLLGNSVLCQLNMSVICRVCLNMHKMNCCVTVCFIFRLGHAVYWWNDTIEWTWPYTDRLWFSRALIERVCKQFSAFSKSVWC